MDVMDDIEIEGLVKVAGDGKYILHGFWHVQIEFEEASSDGGLRYRDHCDQCGKDASHDHDKCDKRREAHKKVQGERTRELLAEGKTEEDAFKIVDSKHENLKLLWKIDQDRDPNFIPPTLERLNQDHLTRKHDFEASADWQVLKAQLEVAQNKGLKITKIVAFGLGSFENNHFGSVRHQTLHTEATILTTLMEFLNCGCQVQDPIFGELEISFLEPLGFKVVEDPKGFENVDGETLAWAIKVGADDIVAKFPAAMICDTWWKGASLRYSSDWANYKDEFKEMLVYQLRMLQEYDDGAIWASAVKNYNASEIRFSQHGEKDLKLYTNNTKKAGDGTIESTLAELSI